MFILMHTLFEEASQTNLKYGQAQEKCELQVAALLLFVKKSPHYPLKF